MTNRLVQALTALLSRKSETPGPVRDTAREWLRTVVGSAESLANLSESQGWHGSHPVNEPRPAIAHVHALAVLELADGTEAVAYLPTDPAAAGADLALLADWASPARVASRERQAAGVDAEIDTLRGLLVRADRRAERAEVVAEALGDLLGEGTYTAARVVAGRMLPDPVPDPVGADEDPDHWRIGSTIPADADLRVTDETTVHVTIEAAGCEAEHFGRRVAEAVRTSL